MSGEPSWEHFPHEADIGVCGRGATPAEAFEQAALALTAVLTDLDAVAAKERIELSCEAPDLELLLAEWLNALVYEMATRHMLFSRYRVRIDGAHLEGTAWGEPIDVARHEPATEIKGATYTGLSVNQRRDDAWEARCVLDV